MCKFEISMSFLRKFIQSKTIQLTKKFLFKSMRIKIKNQKLNEQTLIVNSKLQTLCESPKDSSIRPSFPSNGYKGIIKFTIFKMEDLWEMAFSVCLFNFLFAFVFSRKETLIYYS